MAPPGRVAEGDGSGSVLAASSVLPTAGGSCDGAVAARLVLSDRCGWIPPMTTATSAQTVDAGLGRACWRMWTAAVVSRFGDALRSPALSL